jgi:hypothetical protein
VEEFVSLIGEDDAPKEGRDLVETPLDRYIHQRNLSEFSKNARSQALSREVGFGSCLQGKSSKRV